jgi:hypothetical protein
VCPEKRRDLVLRRQLDHVHAWRIARRRAGPTFARVFQQPKFPRGAPSTPVCRSPATTCTPFKGNIDPLELWPRGDNHARRDAPRRILEEYGKSQSELGGKAVVLIDGKAEAVENVWLDELHGLRTSIRGRHGKWPISTNKFAQTG